MACQQLSGSECLAGLEDKLVGKFESTFLEETVGYDIYKTFEALFLPGGKAGQYDP